MKRSVLTLLLLLAFAGSAFAQIDFGPRFTLITSNIRVPAADPIFDSDFELGYQVGLFARIKLPGTQWYVQPEALYNVSGGIINEPGGAFDYDIQRLDFPVLVGRKLGPVRVNAGPVIRRNLETKVFVPDGTILFNRYLFKEVTLGYQAGVGIDVMNFVFDLKYEGSISDVRNLSTTLHFGAKTRINQLIFAVGYKLF